MRAVEEGKHVFCISSSRSEVVTVIGTRFFRAFFCFCQSVRSNVCGLVMLSSDNNTSNNIVLRVYEQVFMRYMDERTERHFCVVVGSVAVFCISAQKWIDI